MTPTSESQPSALDGLAPRAEPEARAPASTTFASERRSAFVNMLVKGLSVPAEKAARFVVVVVAAPTLGEARFGNYQFAATLTMLLMLCTEMGLAVWTTRTLARDRSRAGEVLGSALRLRGLAMVPYALVVAVIAARAPSEDTRVAVVLMALAAMANAFCDYAAAFFRGFGRLRDEASVNVVRAASTTGIALAALRVHPSIGVFCAALGLGSLAGAACAVLLLRWRYGLFSAGFSLSSGGRRVGRSALAESLPLWLITLASVLYARIDIVLLRMLAGAAEVGAYSAADRLCDSVYVLPGVILAAAFPPLARAHADRALRRRWELLLATLLIAAGGVLAGPLCLGARPIIAFVYGPGYGNAVAPLRLLALGIPIAFLNIGLAHILIARNLERVALLFAALALGANVTMNLSWIPRHGSAGAAFTSLLTEAMMALAYLGLIYRSGRGLEGASP
jgi:O-antigen/teichoic acid export membrane protein